MLPTPGDILSHTLSDWAAMSRLAFAWALVATLAPSGRLAAQLRLFQGPWEIRTADAPPRYMEIHDLRVSLGEPCPGADSTCISESEATPYGPSDTAPAEDAVALVVRHEIADAVRLSVIRFEQGRLLVDAFTRPDDGTGRQAFVEHLVYSRPRTASMNGGGAPQFPWPPPVPTSFQTLPVGLVTAGQGDSLGSVFDRLRVALARIEGGAWSVYAIGEDGFAVVTKLEAIESDGSPKPLPDRWLTPAERLPARIRGIGDYLRALFFAKPGRYRFVVLAVTDRPISGADSTITSAQAMRLLQGGTDILPQALRVRTLGPDGRCVALVYEFERTSEVSEARFISSSPISVTRHLARAGLWEEGRLRP